jgi:hypothetical protein
MLDGQYLVVVSVRDFQGKLRQRLGSLSFQSGQLTLGRVSSEGLNTEQSKALSASRQAQKIETVDNDDITILTEGKARSATLMVHDGQNGQVTSTSGALTFRTGDVLTGQDKEQVRVTPEGRVGIGTDKPEATLDVAGAIRARGGIQFEDGTVLTSAVGTVKSASSTNSLIGGQNIAGTGTANKLAKWTDNSGTLTDSAVTELNGNIGIGTSAPTAALHLYKQTNGSLTSLFIDNDGVGDGTGQAIQFRYGSSGVLGGLYHQFGNGQWNLRLKAWMTTGQEVERLTIRGDSGNVGIGTTVPVSKLEVAGEVRISGLGNGLIFPDGSKMTTASGGVAPLSGTSLINAINDPATTGTISDIRLSANLARLNVANTWASTNVFTAGLSANGTQIVNVGAPVSATDAANKNYVDSTAVRFVPGTEQLSVGDANGTAPMINLRGGSTCYSGPGGHTPAWFKVFQNGSFVATGNLGIGVSPMQGKGYRTSWDSYKGAFRSGYADNEWDDANVGFFSWAGGSNSTAVGLYSLAFGDTNQAESTSSIVFGSGNEVKGAAGFSAGAGVFNCTSSRYTKENFSLVNGNDVLSRLRNIPVSTWNYISEGSNVRHIGPMAEDFYAQFGLGTGATSIGVQDLAAVSLAAVKALDQRTTELQRKTAEVDQLRTEVNELRSANAAVLQRLNALEQNAAKNNGEQHRGQGRRR